MLFALKKLIPVPSCCKRWRSSLDFHASGQGEVDHIHEHHQDKEHDDHDGDDVIVADGKYGPYVRIGKTFASLPKGIDPFSMTLESAVALVEQKQNAALPIHDWGEIKVLRGRYGAYIKQGETNYRIPKSTDVEHMTREDAIVLINATPAEGEQKKRFVRRRSK